MSEKKTERSEVLGSFASPNRDVFMRHAVRDVDPDLYFRQIGIDTRALAATLKNTHSRLLALLLDSDHLLGTRDPQDKEETLAAIALAKKLDVENVFIVEYVEDRMAETREQVDQIDLGLELISIEDLQTRLKRILNPAELETAAIS